MNWLLFYTFNFVLYSFFGWILEEVYSYFAFGYFKEEGFLNIPFKPMYGIAMCLLIMFYYRFEVNTVVLLLLCLIIPTAVEYISGYMLKTIFNEVYWSYANTKYNFQGLICLKFSIYWTVLSFIVVGYAQPYINKFYNKFNSVSNIVALVLMILITLDFVDISIKYIRMGPNNEVKNYSATKIK